MRLPTQVEAIIFRKKEGIYEFLLLKRISERGGFWQPVTGGLESTDKSMLDAVYREVFEEIALKREDIIRVIPDLHTFEFKDDILKTGQPIIVKEHVFAFEVKPILKITLHENVYEEHTDYKWLNFEEASKLLEWEGNKEALKKLESILTS